MDIPQGTVRMGGSHKGQKLGRTHHKVLSSLSSMSTGNIIQGKVAIISHPSTNHVQRSDRFVCPPRNNIRRDHLQYHGGLRRSALRLDGCNPHRKFRSFWSRGNWRASCQANAATSMATIRHPIHHHKRSRTSFHLIMVANIVFGTGHSHRICTRISSPSKRKGGKSWPRNNGTGKEVAGGMRHFMGRSITTNLGPTT